MGEVIRLRVASSEETIRIGALGGNMTIDAFSPRVTLTKVDGGTRLDITDVDGTKSAILPDGETGPMGPMGPSGADGSIGVGIAYCELLPDYRLQITYTNGVFEVVGPIRGPQGEPGDGYVLTEQDKSDIAGLVDTSGKADKVEECTEGNLAALDETGNLTDSGVAASDFLTKAEYIVDNALSDQSENPVQNKVIADELDGLRSEIASKGFVPVSDPATWQLNAWLKSTGGTYGNVTRIRTSADTQISSFDYYIEAEKGLSFLVLFYNGSTYINTDSEWVRRYEVKPHVPSGATGFRLVVRTMPEKNLTDLISETAAKVHFFRVSKMDVDQGAENAGKALVINENGMVVPAANSGVVTDVQMNGTSIVSGGVADVPVASTSAVGVVKVGAGLTINSSSDLLVDYANASESKAGSNYRKPITPYSQHNAAFYGLAKAAGDSTQASSSNAVGKYTAGAMDKILAMLGVSDLIAPREASAVASKAYAVGQVFIYNGKLYKATVAISSGGAIVPGTNCTTTYLVDLI